MPLNRLEDNIARLKASIESSKQIKSDFKRVSKEMDETLSKLKVDKAKHRPRRK